MARLIMNLYGKKYVKCKERWDLFGLRAKCNRFHKTGGRENVYEM